MRHSFEKALLTALAAFVNLGQATSAEDLANYPDIADTVSEKCNGADWSAYKVKTDQGYSLTMFRVQN